MVGKKRGKTVKSVKKRRKVGPKNKSLISKKDFETFKFGVERLKELKKELDSLDTRGFSREEQRIRAKLKNVSEIPTTEEEIKSLKLKIHRKYLPKKTRKRKDKLVIDTGVGVLVSTNFNDFLNEIKTALSERVKRKEKEMDNVLKVDLKRREENFKNKHLNLTREFNEKGRRLEQKRRELEKKYTIKVKKTLQKKVSEKFNAELQKKLDSEKGKLAKRYVGELKKHSKKELGKRKRELEKRLKSEFAGKTALMKKQLEEGRLDEEREIRGKMNKIKELEKGVRRQKEKLNKERENLKEKIEKGKQDFKNKLVDELHKKLEKELSRKEGKIREQLRNNFELKLKSHIQKYEEDLKKKKLNLELEFQKRIKQVLR